MLRFGSEIAPGELNPERSMGVGAGQGRASGDYGPCPLPPDEDGQGLRCLHRVPGPAIYRAHGSKAIQQCSHRIPTAHVGGCPLLTRLNGTEFLLATSVIASAASRG